MAYLIFLLLLVACGLWVRVYHHRQMAARYHRERPHRACVRPPGETGPEPSLRAQRRAQRLR